jgi:Zn-dependent protease with chaperone function
VAVLDGMRVSELQAVLAHEYGHFRNDDAAGGRLALWVRRSLFVMMLSMVIQRVAAVYNPAWWFVRGFQHVFLRISQGASRLQEILADRWAVHAYGSEPFARGLAHVVAQTVRFDAHATASVGEALTRGRAVANLYRFEPQQPVPQAEVDKVVAQALADVGSPFDSHPPPAQRIAWAKRACAVGAPSGCADGDAWSLFEDREAVELRMTELVRLKIKKSRGVDIARDVSAGMARSAERRSSEPR